MSSLKKKRNADHHVSGVNKDVVKLMAMNKEIEEECSISICNESSDFLLPENQITIEIIGRKNTSNIKSFSYKQNPIYLHTCYDEFSRHFSTVNCGKGLPSLVPLVKYEITDPDNNSPKNILRHYDPGFVKWYSTFKKIPQDARHLLNGKIYSDLNLLITLNNFTLMRQTPFEPLFGSFSIYTLVGDDLIRISENFCFDATDVSIRKLYPELYPVDSTKASVNVGDANCVDGFINKFNITIPEELREIDLFFVVQLNKILSCDADKAVSPYKSYANVPPDLKKHSELCKRLINFRQPVGMGIIRLNDEAGKLEKETLRAQVPLYVQKHTIGDNTLHQLIREVFPADGSTQYSRLGDILDIDMKITLFNLGRDDQMTESFDRMLAMKGIQSPVNQSALLIPSQIASTESPLQFTTDLSSLESSGKNVSKFVIREVLPILPTSGLLARESTRQIKARVDNTLFVYPAIYEKFQHRNLSVKVELVEMINHNHEKADMKSTTSNTPTSKALPNIYRSDSVLGSQFTFEAFTRVSYHCRNPQMNDEIKVRLPDVLSSRHWLKFTVVHCHVKPVASRSNILSNLIRPSIEKTLEDCIELGVGYLPIISNGDTLIEDSEYIVLILNTDPKAGQLIAPTGENFLAKSFESTLNSTSMMMNNIGHANNANNNNHSQAEIPFIRVRTKALTSLFSSDKKVQAALKYHPIPLGLLPSSLMNEECALHIIKESLHLVPKEAKLINAIADLSKASHVEIGRHFYVLMRQLIRTMLAGTGVYDEFYVNPYKHNKARCQGFLTMLQVIGKISNDTTNPSSTDETSLEKEFMNAYVDYIFDEEVPISTFNYFTQSVAANNQDDRFSLPNNNHEHSDSVLSLQEKIISDGTSGLGFPSELHRYSMKVKFDEPISSETISIEIAENHKSDIDTAYQSESDDESIIQQASENSVSDNTESKVEAKELGDSKYSVEVKVIDSSVEVKLADTLVEVESTVDSEKTSNNGSQPIERDVSINPPPLETTVKNDSSYLVEENLDDEDIFVGDQIVDESVNLLPASPHRKSWGKYITDALWLSGGLLPLDQLDTDGSSTSFEFSMKYLDEVANHVALQAERLIFEILLSSTVISISKQILDKNSNEEYGIPLNEENIFGKYRFKEPSNEEYGESHSEDNLKRFPFMNSKSWFSAADRGLYFDHRDITVTDDCSNAEFYNSVCNVVEGVKKRNTILDIQPVLPKYDFIEGFRDRTLRIIRLKKQNEEPNATSDSLVGVQWWPWLYEVIVFQWGAVLTITLASINLISSLHTESIVGGYPFEQDHMVPKQKMTTSPAKDATSRYLLFEHGPILLKLIHKSLIYRLKREHKKPPILLDEQFFVALENLVMLLAVEVVTLNYGLWRSRRLNLALISFLRSFFSVITPYQSIRLIRSYFRALRSKNKSDETDLRLQALENVCLFDQMVSVNFPYTMDAPYAALSFTLSSLKGKPEPNSTLQFTAFGIRSATSPNPYCLAHTIISEIFSAYRQDEKKFKDSAIEILRNLILKHACDARYKSIAAQERISCMYLPLIKEIIDTKVRLTSLKYESVERKEILAILFYVLEGIPGHILRHRLRTLCNLEAQSEIDRRLSVKQFSSTFLPEESIKSLGSVNRSSVRVIKQIKQDIEPVGFFPKTSFHDLPIASLIMILHLALDTFEIPKVTLSSVGPSIDFIAQQSALQLLSPNLTVIGDAEIAAKRNTITSLGSTQPTTVAEGQQSRAGNIASLLQNLDTRMQTRKTVVQRKSLTGNIKGDERKWMQHAQKMQAFSEASSKDKAMISQPVDKNILFYATGELSSSVSNLTIQIILIMIQECPKQISETAEGSIDYKNLVVRDNYFTNKALLTGFKSTTTIEFYRSSLTLLLHILFCGQSDFTFEFAFTAAKVFLQRIGAKLFLVSVEDSLQDWIRISLFNCCSVEPKIRVNASNFILYLLQSCYQFLGSFTIVSNVILAVINDVILSILDDRRSIISTYSDEDRALNDLNTSFEQMKSAAASKFSTASIFKEVSVHLSFAKSVVKLMNDLDIILLAHADMRRNLSHPVGYDFYGANLLDPPTDDPRVTKLIHAVREKRKNIKKEANDNQSFSKSGFQIEEVMMHFSQAAEVYDPIKLPRFRMMWLENLARLHEIRQNRAESAEVRWKIYQLCVLVEDTWPNQWVPRPPLEWNRRTAENVSNPITTIMESVKIATNSPTPVSAVDNSDRNFFTVFSKTLDSRPFRAWLDHNQYIKHMELALTVVSERYFAINLIHLAERASTHLIQLYRMNKKLDLITSEYSKIVTNLKLFADKGITSSMAIGTFYRVLYEGSGVPANLRGKEFIFRNATHLHVSEFQVLVVNHLKSVVQEGVDVKIIQDITAMKTLDDEKVAYIIMNSVKLNNSNKNINRSIESLNQVSVFQYSVPFTLDGGKAHAKNIDEQWTRVTTLSVKEPFPYIVTRQQVYKRETKDYSPIEVAINDISERIEAMEVELEKVFKNASDNNNMMRLVQGTVLPQVNAGAAEVAKVFLGALRKSDVQLDDNNMGEYNKQEELKMKLKRTLVEFLKASKQLLHKAHRTLITSPDSFSTDTSNPASPVDSTLKINNNNATNNNTNNNIENTNKIWLTEMNKGYEILVNSIYPFVKDICEVDQFIAIKS